MSLDGISNPVAIGANAIVTASIRSELSLTERVSHSAITDKTSGSLTVKDCQNHGTSTTFTG
jgi:hypothetical protein